MPDARPSTDEESAPLLDHPDEHQSFFSALLHPSRPLTNLEKILAGVAILLLLLTSTFIGLFAGSQNRLGNERGNHEAGGRTETLTATETATRTSIATTTVSAVPTGKPESKLCLSSECVILSAQILGSLNTSMDPCEDFYEFATGGWVSTHDIPADRGMYGAFDEVADNNKKVILKVLNSIPSSLTELEPSVEVANLHKLKSVYTSCMDVDGINERGLEPFLPLANHLLDTFGPFDLVPSPDVESIDETETWRGTWDESYIASADLLASAERLEVLREAKQTGGGQWTQASAEQLETNTDAIPEREVDERRREKMTATLAWLHSRGVQALVNFAIEGDAGGEDSQVQSLWLYQAFGGLPSKEYYEEAPVLDLYQSVVQGILVDIASHTKASATPIERDSLDALIEELVEIEGWPWPWPGDDDKGGNGKKPGGGQTKEEPLEERMEKLAGKVVRFERELIRAGADPEYLFNPHYAYNPYPTTRVSKALPFLSIPAYLATFGPRTYPVNITVTHPPYLHAVTRLIDGTPDYVLSGYFATRLAMTYAGALGPKVGVRQETRRLQEVLRGIKKGTEEDRQDVCLSWVDEIVGFIAGREFVREAFSPEAKDEGEHIIRSIVRAFHDKLPGISWMDQESAAAAQKKANSIIPKVGYPLMPNTTDARSLASWYARLEIGANDFFGNVLRSTLLDDQRVWQTLGRQRSRLGWEMYPQTVDAYYSAPDGEIVFPAGILQPPFYSQAWPTHLKYGAFGAVAAHELTHAFDNSGSQYDDKGRLRDWWTNSTIEAFRERAQCVAKQYSKYYVTDSSGKKVYVNGNLTNGEDIADSGLAQAYSAWKSSVISSAESEIRLPGLDFSQDQLFFLAFARVWAQLTRPATAVARVRTDPHSPPYWRATGTLRNLGAFHEAFGCKEGSGMRPPKAEQCELW